MDATKDASLINYYYYVFTPVLIGLILFFLYIMFSQSFIQGLSGIAAAGAVGHIRRRNTNL
jgi:hypothetical protein